MSLCSIAPGSDIGLFLACDGTVIEIRTNVREVAEFIRRSHGCMLVAAGRAPNMVIDVTWTESGFRIDTEEYEVDKPRWLFDLLQQTIVHTFIGLRDDLLWLHAGVAHANGGALLVVGPSGAGKSTIVTMLMDMEWLYMSDELAPVRQASLDVVAYPRTPSRRVHSPLLIPKNELGGVRKEDVAVDPHMVRREAAPIKGMLFPEYLPGKSGKIRSMKPREVVIRLDECWLRTSEGRANGIDSLVRLAERVPSHMITYSDPLEAAQILEKDKGASLARGSG